MTNTFVPFSTFVTENELLLHSSRVIGFAVADAIIIAEATAAQSIIDVDLEN